MPHKHTRRGTTDKSTFDLPDHKRDPLLVKTSQTPIFTPKRANTKRKRTTDPTDDTPKQFARLMRWSSAGIKLPKGLDDGVDRRPTNKKRKPTIDVLTKITAAEATTKILPGERLSSFAARVDQALPLSNLVSLHSRKDGKPLDPLLAKELKGRSTKHNKRLQRMQKEWREEEARRKARREEKMEEDEERVDQDGNLWSGQTSKKKAAVGLEGKEEDPWAELTNRKREATRQRGLHDVVLAPPELDHRMAVGKGRIFRRVGADVENVPVAVGSLRKREEVAGKRREVIEQYRQRRGGKWENNGSLMSD